ncbi:MAG: PrsW family glutamic-type intramembrane protease [Minisyncoccia bacterium]
MIALSPTLFIALLGGIAPSFLWLAFWLFEDRCEPEPKRYIFFTFIVGGLAVAPVLFLEQYAAGVFAGSVLLLTWAFIEESFKFGAAYLTSLRAYVFDEPLDAVIYLVTAALGFAAVENALFLFGSLQQGVLHGIVTSDLRFIGATLLHTLSSATIGITLALSFYKSTALRRLYALVGVILATALHTLFNFFILGQGGDATFFIFMFIWIGLVGILLAVERIKDPVRDYC